MDVSENAMHVAGPIFVRDRTKPVGKAQERHGISPVDPTAHPLHVRGIESGYRKAFESMFRQKIDEPEESEDRAVPEHVYVPASAYGLECGIHIDIYT